MHRHNLTHTDLKPENILLKYDELKKVTIYHKRYSEHRSSTRSKSHRSTRSYHNKTTVLYEPMEDKIKIIDMGGATWDYDHKSSVINTR